MRAITVFGVLFAATTAWASSYETDDSDGLKKQCFLSTDFAHKADPGLKSISPPYAISPIMGELGPSLYDGKMAMVTRIQADPFTQHFELQDFSFACVNTSGRCILHVKGYRDDYIDTPTVVASWPGDVQHNTAMTRVHLPSEYTKLVEVEFIITDFAGSTFDPALLIDDVRHCNSAEQLCVFGQGEVHCAAYGNGNRARVDTRDVRSKGQVLCS